MVFLSVYWRQKQRVRVLEEHSLSAIVQRVLVNACTGATHPVSYHPLPAILLATLPGEHHTLGLSMVKSVLHSLGARVVRFDTQVLALSLSRALAPQLGQQELTLLMQQLPPHVCLWLGVAALRRVPPKTQIFTSCTDFASALAAVSAQVSCH